MSSKKLGNPISHEEAMTFFWWSLVLVGPWHIFTFSAVSLALSSKIQTFCCHCVACSLAIRFKPKNSKIRYRTRELWAFSGEGWSWSVPSSVLTHLHFFSRFSLPEFQNPKFLLLLHSLLYCRSIQAKKPRNPISHEGPMNFFWWSLVVVGPILSSNTSSLFQQILSPSASKSKLSSVIA
jgi:hypothetical protein